MLTNIQITTFEGGYFIWDFKKQLAVIFEGDSDIPKSVLMVYELFNPFVFKNMIVLPGRDYIICYDVATGEYGKNHIR